MSENTVTKYEREGKMIFLANNVRTKIIKFTTFLNWVT